MFVRTKFWLLAGAFAAIAASAINADGGTLRPVAHATLGHSWVSPASIAQAKSSGLLFVSDINDHVIDIFAAKNPTTPIGQIQGLLSLPEMLSVDKSGNLFVYDGRTNSVVELVPPYTGKPIKS